ncbi:hypothetical protein BUALT_Bualt04G0087500 [Buddleja alternifolia]|uniref:Retrotransposon gag domain-containing protein n=1 Tax=Buddleja alternifolia TaxID=168488 RepID=A0AAV6XVG8_9LAMI|nr:hypothetical protein BUALT_Bualt04G0087500 [Buddleja alternifolia]
MEKSIADAKVKIAAIHLEGKALPWHQIFMKNRLTREVPQWGEYVRALNDRFGALLDEDPMSELVNLKQTGSIQDYLDRFDELMNCVDLSEPYAISCFLGDLKSEVVIHFTPGHQCSRRKQLYIMEVTEDEGEEDELEQSEELAGGNKGENSEHEGDHTSSYHVSMNAMIGIHDFRTMRVTETCKGKPIHILINTGGTHNFLDLHVAQRLGCRLESTKPFPVAVADGSRIYSSHVCKDFSWKMQGTSFTTDMMILPLGGCEIVLGIQWGKQPPAIETVNNKKMRKHLHNPAQVAIMQVGVFATAQEEESSCLQIEEYENTTTGNSDLDSLLCEFRDVFEEPTSLPPPRLHDHAITLKDLTDGAYLWAMTRVNSELLLKIKQGWLNDEKLQGIIHKLIDDPDSKPKYEWKEGLLTRKGRLAQRNIRAITQVFVKWFNAPEENSTWENFHELRLRFPAFNP